MPQILKLFKDISIGTEFTWNGKKYKKTFDGWFGKAEDDRQRCMVINNNVTVYIEEPVQETPVEPVKRKRGRPPKILQEPVIKKPRGRPKKVA